MLAHFGLLLPDPRGSFGDDIVLPSWGRRQLSCSLLRCRRPPASRGACFCCTPMARTLRRGAPSRDDSVRSLSSSRLTRLISTASLETARLAQAPDEIPFVEYLRSLFARRDLNLVVTMGAPAARFVQRYRTQVFAATPLLITGADQRFISTAALTWNDTAVASTVDSSKLIENAFQVLPDTSNIAFAIGNSPLERLWVDELCRVSQAFAHRASFEWWNEFSLEEMARRAATRPKHSVIFYAGVRVDAHGVPHEEDLYLPGFAGPQTHRSLVMPTSISATASSVARMSPRKSPVDRPRRSQPVF
jgi:hypothetical protein